jgi:hypothetical protein
MVEPVIRAARQSDLKNTGLETYGYSFKGIVAELDGRVIGVTGVAFTAPLQAFGWWEEEMRQYRKTMVKAGRLMQGLLRSFNAPIYAKAHEDVPQACRFLEWAGFKESEEDPPWYIWMGEFKQEL